ncbi:hypothetical protein GGR52DRAFT_589879, partial [Hypoxylon sp. FL1284]
NVLRNHRLPQDVLVLGSGRFPDGLVVTPSVKAAAVCHLQRFHAARVYAFGDSPLDLPMLKVADRPVVVVGDENTRSKTMDSALLDAIDNDGLRALQVLLPDTVMPRLDATKLPIMRLSDLKFVTREASGLRRRPRLGVVNRPTAQLLMTPTRDWEVAGPSLRHAHVKIGWFLAVQHLTGLLGVEPTTMRHVHGHMVKRLSAS